MFFAFVRFELLKGPVFNIFTSRKFVNVTEINFLDFLNQYLYSLNNLTSLVKRPKQRLEK
jgi:hypothetical protein